MDPHKGQGNQSSASKVLADEAIDGFSILESSQKKAGRPSGWSFRGNIAW
jgi:hypothetical protein